MLKIVLSFLFVLVAPTILDGAEGAAWNLNFPGKAQPIVIYPKQNQSVWSQTHDGGEYFLQV